MTRIGIDGKEIIVKESRFGLVEKHDTISFDASGRKEHGLLDYAFVGWVESYVVISCRNIIGYKGDHDINGVGNGVLPGIMIFSL